jgi:serine/threonine protein kinase
VVGEPTNPDEPLVALKLFLNPQGTDDEVGVDVVREIAFSIELDHPNLIKASELALTEGKSFSLVLPLMDRNLHSYLVQRTTPISEAQLRWVVVSMLSALNYLHARNFIHRDFKPQNILLKWDPPLVVLADYGLTRWASVVPYPYSPKGTPVFLAPEVGGNQSYDGRVDIWGLGCVIGQLLQVGWTRPVKLFPGGPLGGPPELIAPHVSAEAIAAKFPHASAPLVDLLTMMMIPVAHARITAAQALQHPWCTGPSVHLDQLEDEPAVPLSQSLPDQQSSSSSSWTIHNAVT